MKLNLMGEVDTDLHFSSDSNIVLNGVFFQPKIGSAINTNIAYKTESEMMLSYVLTKFELMIDDELKAKDYAFVIAKIVGNIKHEINYTTIS